MRGVFNLSRSDLDSLENKFKRYPMLDREVAMRKEELKIKEHDTNTGGGKSSYISNPVENQVIKEMSDPFISNRVKWKEGVEATLNGLSDEIEELVEEKFWGSKSFMDWTTFGEIHGYSKSSIYRLRYQVLKTFAEEIGDI